MREEGRAAAGGVLRGGGESLLSHGFAVPAPPEGKPRALRAVLAPRIYEGGGPRSGRGSPPAAAGKASSVTASPCQLPRRGSRGRCAPFLPPAFMRGEGREAAGGVLRGGGENLLSHGFAVPAPPEGKPRVLRTVLAPRIYEGGGPRSGRGSPPPPRGKPPQSRLRRASSPGGEAEGAARQLSQGESQGRFAPFLPPAFMRGEGHAVAGGVSRAAGKASSVTASPCQLPQRGSRGRCTRQLSQRESQGGCAPFLPPAFMRGEGREAAGGVPRRRGDGPLSHASRASSPRGRAKGAAPRSCPPHL